MSLASLLACGFHARAADAPAAAAAPQRPAARSFLPLAVGNEWVYRCSVEGEYQNDKTVKLVSKTEKDGVVYFKALMTTGDADGALEYFLHADARRDVYSSFQPSAEGAELQVTAALAKGDQIAALTVRGPEKLETARLGTLEVVRVESFDIEEPLLSEERRMDWVGRFYARGIGLVAEADGLGGECELTKHRVQREED